MTYRNRSLLDIAHDAPCFARFPHRCNGPSVPAHSNQQAHGRGFAHKADDFLIAAVCPEAHDFIDGRKGGWTKDEKQAEWDRAHVAFQRWAWSTGRFRAE